MLFYKAISRAFLLEIVSFFFVAPGGGGGGFTPDAPAAYKVCGMVLSDFEIWSTLHFSFINFVNIIL